MGKIGLISNNCMPPPIFESIPEICWEANLQTITLQEHPEAYGLELNAGSEIAYPSSRKPWSVSVQIWVKLWAQALSA